MPSAHYHAEGLVNYSNSRTRRPAARRQPAQRRVANQTGSHDAPGSGAAHTFNASIEALSLATDSLSALVRDWLVRGIQAVALAVKQQLAQLAAPPVRQLPPPKGPDTTDDRGPNVAEGVARRPR